MSPRTLLHLDSSILGDHSVSRQVTAAAVARLEAAEPNLQIVYRDLAAEPLPHASPASMPADHPLCGGSGTDNRVAIYSDRYDEQPLVVQGPGAGARVTAAALLDDVLAIAAAR